MASARLEVLCAKRLPQTASKQVYSLLIEFLTRPFKLPVRSQSDTSHPFCSPKHTRKPS